MAASVNCVEQQHALLGPAHEAPALGRRRAEVGLYLLEYVDERRRKGHAVVHREAQSLRLPRLMVGVLADDNGLHLVERTQVEGVEDEPPRRITRAPAVLVVNERRQGGEIRFVELGADVPPPALLYLYVHMFMGFSDMQK